MAIVGFHMGAGPAISSDLRAAYQDISREIVALGGLLCCQEKRLSASEVAIHIMALLEDSPYTNCGTGSELTLNGDVECDACLMQYNNGKRATGAVTGLSGVRYPSKVCWQLIKCQLEPSSKIGRAEPVMLAGVSANEFARKHQLELADLITSRARNVHKRWISILQKHEPGQAKSLPGGAHSVADTVGVFVINGTDDYACCCSSGGTLLKSSGRLGPAAIPGCGIELSLKSQSMALVSGFGEDILTCELARQLCNSGDDLESIATGLRDDYLFQRGLPFGALRVVVGSKDCYIDFYHTTPNMPLAVFDTKSGWADCKLSFSSSRGGTAGGWKFPTPSH